MKNYSKTIPMFPFSHHAYLINMMPSVDDLREHIGDKHIEYIHAKRYESFKIDDARNIINLQKEKTKKAVIFIINADSINYQAQNALLKTIENPSSNTYFFFTIANTQDLLDTMLSRLEIIHVADRNTVEKNKEWFLAFLSLSLFEKLEFIKKSTDKKKDDFLNHSDVRDILNVAETHFVQDIPRYENVITQVYKLKEYISSNGASLKMILDSLALTIEQDIH